MDRDLIAALRARIDAGRAKMGLDSPVRLQTRRQDDGSPHVEIVAGRYDIVVTDRGQEPNRFAGLTRVAAVRRFMFSMANARAQALELRDRRPTGAAPPIPHGLNDDGYSRWNWMALAIEFMDRISPEDGDWARSHYAEVLRRAPLAASERRNARWPLPSDGD